MKKVMLAVVAFVALFTLASAFPAHASSADFQGYCTPISYTCDFDSARGSGTSCTAPLTISSYAWSFTNATGTATGATSTHAFATNAGGNATLTITCSNGTTATKTRSACFGFSFPGCIIPNNATWN